jgi:serine/threonine-protein kinase
VWQQVKQRFAAALQLEPPARQAYLDRECADDLVLRAEVESLLAFAEAGGVSVQSRPAERAALAAGSRLGDYEVVSLLGSGGSGGVYRARDLRLHRDVAIKVLPEALSADAAALHRFEREAMAAARLNHPHIVTIHSIEHAGAFHLIVMELVEGQTLDRIIPKEGLSLEKFLDLAAELSDAVAAAHGKGIIHRDLKPGNIMVDNRGRIKILDFGIAKMTELAAPDASELQETEPGMVMGTFPYMSPEQVEGKKLDSRTDIFSLGAVFYQMATGERPFRGNTHAELISAILRDKPKSVVGRRADLPLSLQRILERCLAKKVEERYTAPELHDAIEQLRQKNASRRHAASIASAERPHVRSLAVLPLENLSHDPEQEYFAEGLTEALITTLAKIGELRVVSRTTVMHYKGVHRPLPQIAEELNVDGIVEGTVLRSGDRVRISTQLVHGSTDTHLWAESYDRDLRDVLALQSEVAQAIAREVRVKLTPQDQAHLVEARRIDPEAYEAYLKGRYYWHQRSREGFGSAVRFLEQGIAKDPVYAAAYSGLADAVSIMGLWGLVPPEDGCGRAKKLALQALEMDGGLAEAHTSLAWATAHYDYDFVGAERGFERSMELNPRYATAHLWFGMLLSLMARYEEAYTELMRAIRLEPDWSNTHFGLAFVYWSGRRYAEAIERCKKALELDPNSVQARFILGMSCVANSMYEPAIVALCEAVELSRNAPVPLASLAEAYVQAGQRDEACKILKELLRSPRVSSYFVACIYAALSEKDEAFRWLETAYREHAEWLIMLKVDARLDNLRPDPRFQGLLRRMNFPS